jgi:hypothetical protein
MSSHKKSVSHSKNETRRRPSPSKKKSGDFSTSPEFDRSTSHDERRPDSIHKGVSAGYTDDKSVYLALAEVNPHGPAQFADTFMIGMFCYMILLFSDSRHPEQSDYLTQCYLSWMALSAAQRRRWRHPDAPVPAADLTTLTEDQKAFLEIMEIDAESTDKTTDLLVEGAFSYVLRKTERQSDTDSHAVVDHAYVIWVTLTEKESRRP